MVVLGGGGLFLVSEVPLYPARAFTLVLAFGEDGDGDHASNSSSTLTCRTGGREFDHHFNHDFDHQTPGSAGRGHTGHSKVGSPHWTPTCYSDRMRPSSILHY